jgi:hypothetical protein
MKKFFGSLLTGFAIFFSIPTILILASWNAIPGDKLYSVKSSLEDVALALTANTRIATAFSVKFTDRRFNEAAILLDKKGSTVGYELLVAEARQTQNLIVDKKDVKNGAQLIRKIEGYQTEIQKKQAEVQSLAPAPAGAYQTPFPTPYVADPTIPPTSGENKSVTVIVPVEVIIEEEDPIEVINNLEDVIDELEEIKEEIEEELPEVDLQTITEQEDFETVEIEEGTDEETTDEETSNRDKKDKDKNKPLKN